MGYVLPDTPRLGECGVYRNRVAVFLSYCANEACTGHEWRRVRKRGSDDRSGRDRRPIDARHTSYPSSPTVRFVFIIPNYNASLSQRPSFMPLRRLLPFLSCPLCAVDGGSAPHPLLRHPFTLHCGHTVCLSHLKTLDPAQRCPLPVCSSTPNPNTARPNIPSSSRVVYLAAVPPPAPIRPTASTSSDQFDQRVDVTISKLIDVVSRHSKPPSPPADRGESDLSEEGDSLERLPQTATLPSSDEESEVPILSRTLGHRRRRRPAPELTPHPTIPNRSESTLTPATSSTIVSTDSVHDILSSSGHAGRSCGPPPPTAGGESSDGSDPSTEPPKKRLRRDSRSGEVTDRVAQSRAIEPEAETGNSENANRLRPNRLDAEPRRDPEGDDDDPQTRIEKELLTELSCDICFTIYYQPVTTPCQHVSRLLFCFVVFLSNSTRTPPGIFAVSWRRHPDVRSGVFVLFYFR